MNDIHVSINGQDHAAGSHDQPLRRVQRAAELLITQNVSMDVIAQQRGLGNRSYLSRQFRRIIGCQPGQSGGAEGNGQE